jgi:hypothetical protein
MAWVVREAANRMSEPEYVPFMLPRSAAVNDWPKWARGASQWAVVDPHTEKVKAGDIVCFDFHGRDNSGGTHIAIATGNETSAGTFETVEGNTSPDGSRDGNGVYLRNSRTRKGVFSVLRYTGAA